MVDLKNRTLFSRFTTPSARVAVQRDNSVSKRVPLLNTV